MSEPFKLHPFYERHLGHCQVTYVTKNNQGQKIVYCLQQEFKTVRLMRCTQDGEPQNRAYPQSLINFERPKIEDSLTAMVNEWINRHEVEFMNFKGAE